MDLFKDPEFPRNLFADRYERGHPSVKDFDRCTHFMLSNSGGLKRFFKVARPRELSVYDPQAIRVTAESTRDV
jgi:hypothetical protein